MFGIIGAIIYGIAYTIGWSRDEQQEQYIRKKFKEANIPYYYDKKGRQRWTCNGKKRTPQEILKDYEDERRRNEIEANKQIEKKALEGFKKSYDLYVIHKENLSFEQYVYLHMSPSHLKYETFRKIKESISNERIKEIKNNPTKYS